jgi:hypothetical protein
MDDELRDIDGQPVTWQQARTIVTQRYHIPEEVRQRSTQRTRQARRDRRAEQKRKRRSRPAK